MNAKLEASYAAYLAAYPPPERKPDGRSSTAYYRFKDEEARTAYFAELAEANAEIERIAQRGTLISAADEPAWLRPAGMSLDSGRRGNSRSQDEGII